MYLVEIAGYAIQCLLQHYTSDLLPQLMSSQDTLPRAAEAAGAPAGGADGGAAAEAGLYALLPEDVQRVVRPYLTTRFTLERGGGGAMQRLLDEAGGAGDGARVGFGVLAVHQLHLEAAASNAGPGVRAGAPPQLAAPSDACPAR